MICALHDCRERIESKEKDCIIKKISQEVEDKQSYIDILHEKLYNLQNTDKDKEIAELKERLERKEVLLQGTMAHNRRYEYIINDKNNELYRTLESYHNKCDEVKSLQKQIESNNVLFSRAFKFKIDDGLDVVVSLNHCQEDGVTTIAVNPKDKVYEWVWKWINILGCSGQTHIHYTEKEMEQEQGTTTCIWEKIESTKRERK